MKGDEIRKRFINYFVKVLEKEKLSHVEVPSSSLVPERHPTLLFVNSGMVQFTPYFLGERDPEEDFGSKRLCSIQKCIRTGDLDIVGKSKYHLTFFEMMGSWSIGDYDKKKAVELAHDLLCNKDYGFGLDPNRFHPTVFRGNDDAPLDQETINAWICVGVPEGNISKLSAKENWWAPAGLKGPGPCGPCTEVLYDRGPKFGKKEKNPGATDNPRYLEIWNAGVFIQFNRDEKGKLHPLSSLSVDTGAGLERFAVLLQGVDSVYETDFFLPIIEKIIDLSDRDIKDPKAMEALRRSSDHIRAATFIISENVYPSNTDQGYVLRRLLRNTFNDFSFLLKVDPLKIGEVAQVVIDEYKNVYPEIDKHKEIVEVIKDEYEKYTKVSSNTKRFIKRNYLNKGKREIENPFDIYQSTGASLDLIKNISDELDIRRVDDSKFESRAKQHQKLSRMGAGKKFKGGLADYSEGTTKLHTATHLLHASLRKVLGDGVEQKGSNITSERLRFDFSHPQKLSDSEIKKVEDMLNKQVEKDLKISSETMNFEEAKKIGALAFFGEKYGEKIKVYTIGFSDKLFSREVCGGPHVKSTSEIGHVKITKQEKLGTGLVRIYAVIT